MENVYEKIVNGQFGIIQGSKKLVFIKIGRGGSINGYNNKYVNLANKLRNKFGYSIVISANPQDSVCVLKEELEAIKTYISDYEEVFFIGISNGSLIGAQQGYLNEEITKMLLINGPLMINWPKTKKGIEKFKGEIVEMLYGTKDPSYGYFDILNCINSERLKFRKIENADHNFKGMEEVLEFEITSFIGIKI